MPSTPKPGISAHFCTRRRGPRLRLYTQAVLSRSPAPKSPSRFVYFSRSYASREVSGARAPRASRDDRAAGADSTAELGRRPPQTHHGRAYGYFPRTIRRRSRHLAFKWHPARRLRLIRFWLRINIKPTYRAVTATNITGEAAPSVLLTPHEALRPTHCLVAASGGHK